ncbi:DEAD/DEAH box helicase family protein [Herbiconiux sp. CPCC 203406]|uniref:DEAD/DEAH box helicase n=1 Tax=Herbiconiux oxytropis TaxID=2970915 RepID=UPI00217DDE0A|nr:DEAD/DEAH box helicase family protein [Herbiconiux oxytropis]MCS5723476.1 DEAD/DEAH box helicase family protein [Herbiconiux oxytropis]
MKFKLKDYQQDAVIQVLDNLRRARRLYHVDDKETSFALSATTGAGKTVMAAAAIEALFYGNDQLDFDPDPGAVVLWFSDDPNLNDQTRMRLMQASDKLTHDQLVMIKPPFSVPVLEPRRVYFLNTQRLSKNSLLTRGADALEDDSALVAPDDLAFNIWQTLASTIDDEGLTVYMVLDEAHRGFNANASREKTTIVRSLVRGDGSGLPIPVVWGISATVQRFSEAMAEADAANDRVALPPVTVDPTRVQASGLIKDTVRLDIPAEHGNLETNLAARAARKLKGSSNRWSKYLAAQAVLPGEKTSDTVQPLLVLQVPNTEDPDDVGRWLDVVAGELGDLTSSGVRHVLGDHSSKTFGSWEIDYIEPQRVQETTQVRVLVAKDGISTGWDCPRAEVLLSFRPAKDHTHITQLLGRMVRTPLARRVPGDDHLNSVDCILPHFDRATAGNVAKFLTGIIDTMPGTGLRVLLDPRDLQPNPNIPEQVWEVWDELPHLIVPQRGARPVKQVVQLAHALSTDGITPGAIASVKKSFHGVFDSLAERHDGQVRTAEIEVKTVRGMTISGSMGATKLKYTDFVERADDRAVAVAFEDAKRAFGADIALSYVDHLAGDDEDDVDGSVLREAYVKAAALAVVRDVRDKVDGQAKEIVDELLAEARVAIRGLSDERQGVYEEIKSLAVEPQRTELRRPRIRTEDFADADGNQITFADQIDKHLMSDEQGWFPLTSLNEWEKQVVRKEVARIDCVGWYRNPSVSAADSLGVTYRDIVGNWRALHPDFIFFNEINGQVKPSIVDPHGHHLDDAVVKLVGLAEYVDTYGGDFHRIESLADVNGLMTVLDLLDPAVRAEVRNAVRDGRSALELYQTHGKKYA